MLLSTYACIRSLLMFHAVSELDKLIILTNNVLFLWLNVLLYFRDSHQQCKTLFIQFIEVSN